MSSEFNPAQTVAGKQFDDKTMSYIVSLFKEGKDAGFIVSNLVEHGYDYQKSYDIVTAIDMKIRETHSEKEKSNGPLNLILGIIILVIGIAVTASGAGIIAYGAILVGIIKIIRGIVSFNQ